jgi:autoinducer 2-degrading protein
MIVVVVTWMAKAGREAEVEAVFSRLSEESRKEPGCLLYQAHRHKTETRRFLVYEQYRDDAALESHRTTPHFLRHAKKELPQVAERVEGNLYTPVG